MPHPPNHPGPKVQAQLQAQTETFRRALRDVHHHPDPDPVHDLRSTIRRIEALLQPLPAHSNQFLKATKPIRQASGLLRDLDIQANLLAQLPDTQPLHHEIQHLTRHLRKLRSPQVTRLQQQLHKHHSGLHDLLAALESLESSPVPQPAHLAQSLFTETAATLDPRDPLQLHGIRKAARISRYIAETAPSASKPSSLDARAARHFQHIQQVIGTWHDWLTLTETAHEYLDPGSPLIPVLKQHRDSAHRAALKLFTPKPSTKPAGSPVNLAEAEATASAHQEA